MKSAESSLTRRSFLGTVAATAALGQSIRMDAHAQDSKQPQPQQQHAGKLPIFVSTWPFGKPANEDALRAFTKTNNILDAIEQGIWNAEGDVNNASVGLNGIPNAAGV